MEVCRYSIDLQASYLRVEMDSTPTRGVKRKLCETDIEDDFPDWQRSFILEMSLEKLQQQQEPLRKYKSFFKDPVLVERPLRRSVLLENTIKRIKKDMPQDVFYSTKMKNFVSHSLPLPGIGTFISPMTPVPVPVEEESEVDCEGSGCSELESSLTELLPCRPLVDSKDSLFVQNQNVSFYQTGQISSDYSTMPYYSPIPSLSACSSGATLSADGMLGSAASLPFDSHSLDSALTLPDYHINPPVSVLSGAGDSNSVTFQWPSYNDSMTSSTFEGGGLSEAELTEILKYLEEAIGLETDTEQNSGQLPPRRPC